MLISHSIFVIYYFMIVVVSFTVTTYRPTTRSHSRFIVCPIIWWTMQHPPGRPVRFPTLRRSCSRMLSTRLELRWVRIIVNVSFCEQLWSVNGHTAQLCSVHLQLPLSLLYHVTQIFKNINLWEWVKQINTRTRMLTAHLVLVSL